MWLIIVELLSAVNSDGDNTEEVKNEINILEKIKEHTEVKHKKLSQSKTEQVKKCNILPNTQRITQLHYIFYIVLYI
jgi:hypothetical protein